jgi:hypothetical protein
MCSGVAPHEAVSSSDYAQIDLKWVSDVRQPSIVYMLHPEIEDSRIHEHYADGAYTPVNG